MSAERSVLITGCSSGIGLGLVRMFLARGWKVTAAVRNPGAMAEAPGGARVVALDLADEARILSVAAGFDRLDCLVNNAGYALTGPFSSYAPEQMRRQLQVNVLGPALLTQALLPALARASGRVINVSSVAGEVGMPMNSFYCASKFAVEGLTESLRHELAEAGVQLAMVEPAGFRTRFAANMEWGARPPAAGTPADRQLADYRAMQARMLSRGGRTPAPVIEAIADLAEMTTMPLRTRVGSDARALRRLRRWLPEALFLKIVGVIYRRSMGRGKTS